jgi:hypothetical protein
MATWFSLVDKALASNQSINSPHKNFRGQLLQQLYLIQINLNSIIEKCNTLKHIRYWAMQ